MLNVVCKICGKIHSTEKELFKCYSKNSDKVDWGYISRNQTLTESFIEKFQDKVHWYWISEYQELSESFIERFQNKVSWYYISRCQELSESFIEKFQDKVTWCGISCCQTLTGDFIRKFQHKVDWGYISRYQKLSEDFIREFQDKVNWWHISSYQNLSESFIKEFKDKLDIKAITKSKDHHITVEAYAAKYNLKIDSEYLYAYRNHDKRGAGNYKPNSCYKAGTYYRDWHCDVNPLHKNSYGFGIWPKGNTAVKVKLSDWGTAVYGDGGGKARVWGFEVV